ncbi:hypothetical protein PR001_g30855 [Phytophthora rubi]|uniref:ZSWIM3 N-terminal domain-containing protein n=1 Tax=Phytophthora rubi TaxID=129364 RepID=A0A6A3GKU7_9STRA|nr:hypothetical protein PR001_g30855 [Phytophthora rubi]
MEQQPNETTVSDVYTITSRAATRKRKASTCSLSYENTSDDNPSTSGELRDGPHHDLIDGDPTGCQEELTDNHQNAEAEPNSVNEGPPLKSKSFVSWNEFHAYLDTYQAQTYQMFRVRSNKSVAARNQIISGDKSKAAPIPEAWGYYANTFECTHAGKYTRRGQGKRACQQTRALDCKAQVSY